MKGLLVSGGNKVNFPILERESKNSFIVCADGGIKNFVGTYLKPDLIVGDFDSIDDNGKKFVKEKNLEFKKYPCQKDFTDTEAALEILLEKNVDEIVILGATGTRLDHTVSNIFLLQKLFGKINAKLIDNNNEIYYFENGIYEFEKSWYKYISVIPISTCVEYSTEGLLYDTNHIIINSTSGIGVSNEILNQKCKINIYNGKGFIIKSND
ncbi:thiamine diphosphokinase [Peptoniphilus sp. oral taxon 386]|uniref:thiamine diphosphokinase n=1 Tax=Peptoniphilus sp. oral taxon 386 TaxID=652713 RepID=UPI0001DA9C0F|nr:thiamine diphosphokinase [Peptoniphilus sp. oral taxon 386]EFI42204.1 thiamine diphosphokinase [Peptoniphilus sp. oral taxon 386 str. F0131]